MDLFARGLNLASLLLIVGATAIICRGNCEPGTPIPAVAPTTTADPTDKPSKPTKLNELNKLNEPNKLSEPNEAITNYAAAIKSAWDDLRAGKFDAAKATLATTDESLRSVEYSFILGRLGQSATDYVAANIGRRLLPASGRVSEVLIAADSNHAFIAGQTATLSVIDLTGKAEVQSIVLDPENAQNAEFYVTTLAATGDRARIVAATTAGSVYVVDGREVKLQSSFSAGDQPITSLAVSPDGAFIATVMKADQVVLWKADGTKVAELGKAMNFGRPVAFSHDSKFVGLGGMSRIEMFDTATGAAAGELGGQSPYAMALAFSSDGKFMATGSRGSSDKSVYLFDRASGERLHQISEHSRGINNVSFSPDGRRLLSASSDGTIRLTDTQTGAPVWTVDTGKACGSGCFSPDGRWIAWSSAKGAEAIGPILPK